MLDTYTLSCSVPRRGSVQLRVYLYHVCCDAHLNTLCYVKQFLGESTHKRLKRNGDACKRTIRPPKQQTVTCQLTMVKYVATFPTRYALRWCQTSVNFSDRPRSAFGLDLSQETKWDQQHLCMGKMPLQPARTGVKVGLTWLLGTNSTNSSDLDASGCQQTRFAKGVVSNGCTKQAVIFIRGLLYCK